MRGSILTLPCRFSDNALQRRRLNREMCTRPSNAWPPRKNAGVIPQMKMICWYFTCIGLGVQVRPVRLF